LPALRALRRHVWAALFVVLAGLMTAPGARADALARGTAAFHRADYVRAFHELRPVAELGNAKALALLGFMYEHGFGAPQAYEAAADLYCQSAVQGYPFGQAMLGLMYDKGHGVPQNFFLAYMWLDLAAARTHGHERDVYARFRDAVASKMSKDEIVIGQRLALAWVPVSFAPLPAPRDWHDPRYYPR
jgi:TPR repeat protein